MSAKMQAKKTRVGKYELEKALGEGSFAKVNPAGISSPATFFDIKILDRDQVLRHKMVEQDLVNRETHFASQSPGNEIMSKLEEAAQPLDFNVVEQNYKVFQLAPALLNLELRKGDGDTLEFHKVNGLITTNRPDNSNWRSAATYICKCG